MLSEGQLCFSISKYVAVIDKRGICTDAISISGTNQHQEDKNSQLVRIVNEHPANIWQVNIYQQYTKDLSGKRNYHMAQVSSSDFQELSAE